MTHQQHLLEQFFNLIGVKTDKLGQGGEVGNCVAGQRFKDDVGFTAPLDLAAGGDALRVSKQNDLQENGGIVGCAACVVVAILGVKPPSVSLVVQLAISPEFS